MKKAWLITLLSGLTFIGAAIPMALRIRRFNADAHYTRFHAERIIDRQIHLKGYPILRLEDQPGQAPGSAALKLTYGEESASPGPEVRIVPVHPPPAPNLPRLDAYEEWARLLAINEVQRDQEGNPVAKPGTERFLLVVRRTPEGFEADGWGSVRRSEWLFDFYEFLPDGKIAAETRRWPLRFDREKDFQERARQPAPSGKPDERLVALADVPPLQERTLEYFAAMHVIPKLNVPKYKFSDTAFSFHTLGWTLPITMVSGLVFSVAFFFAIAPMTDRSRAGAPAAGH